MGMNGKRSSKKSGAAVAVLLLLLPVLYVASSGPANRLVCTGRVSEQTFNLFYAPLLWAAYSSETALDILTAYVSFFC